MEIGDWRLEAGDGISRLLDADSWLIAGLQPSIGVIGQLYPHAFSLSLYTQSERLLMSALRSIRISSHVGRPTNHQPL